MVGRMPASLLTAAARACRGHAGDRTDLERIRAAQMSLNGSQRRDQRRRLVVSWNRSKAGDSAAAVSDPRPMAAYGPEAHPEKQQGPATLLPTGAGGLTLAAIAMLVPVGAALALAAAGPVFGRPVFAIEGRFARTMQAAAACFDPRSMQSLAGWLAQVSLGVAAAVALIVRLMRRHRRDDYNGRYRAWGWLAGLFVITSCAGAVPLGPLFGAGDRRLGRGPRSVRDRLVGMPGDRRLRPRRPVDGAAASRARGDRLLAHACHGVMGGIRGLRLAGRWRRHVVHRRPRRLESRRDALRGRHARRRSVGDPRGAGAVRPLAGRRCSASPSGRHRPSSHRWRKRIPTSRRRWPMRPRTTSRDSSMAWSRSTATSPRRSGSGSRNWPA